MEPDRELRHSGMGVPIGVRIPMPVLTFNGLIKFHCLDNPYFIDGVLSVNTSIFELSRIMLL